MTELSIRPMTPDDIPAALGLCRLAQWGNQTVRDLGRLLCLTPNGCFVGEASVADGVRRCRQAVATITTTPHGRNLGWIGMLLVHPSLRSMQLFRILSYSLNPLSGP